MIFSRGGQTVDQDKDQPYRLISETIPEPPSTRPVRQITFKHQSQILEPMTPLLCLVGVKRHGWRPELSLARILSWNETLLFSRRVTLCKVILPVKRTVLFLTNAHRAHISSCPRE